MSTFSSSSSASLNGVGTSSVSKNISGQLNNNDDQQFNNNKNAKSKSQSKFENGFNKSSNSSGKSKQKQQFSTTGNAESELSEKRDIVLNSPVGGKPARFSFTNFYPEEIIETIRWVSKEYIEFKPAIENLLHNKEVASYDDVKDLCDRYNKITSFVNRMNKGTSIALKTSSRPSPGLLKHLMHHIYSQSITDPEKLNQYAPFSSEVYGETSYEFVAQMIDDYQTRPCDKDTFIDLGCGVGQVVLQIAASVDCKKCYGIEKADVPANFSKFMEEKFRFWMDWFGKKYTEFEIFHGDFFDEKFSEIIKESTHLFINNFAFEPEVNHKLKQIFIDLKDGTRIISSKKFCPLKTRLTERDLTDIGSIMHVIEIQPEQKKDSVSWTDKIIPYYLHTLDGTRVEKYYEKQKLRYEKNESLPKRKRLTKSQSNSPSSNESKTVTSSKMRKTRKIIKNSRSLSNSKNITNENDNRTKESSNVKASKRKRAPTTESFSSDQTLIATMNDSGHSSQGSELSKKKKKSSNNAKANLDVLHEKTVESIAMDFSKPAVGCINHNLAMSSDKSTIPNIVINSLPMYLATRNMNKLCANLRDQFEEFAEKIKRPGTREQLLLEIKKEKDKKQELISVQDNLTRHIGLLSNRANKAAGVHCDIIGIENSSKSIISHLAALLEKHQELSKQMLYLGTYPLPTRRFVANQSSPPAAHSQKASPVLGWPFRPKHLPHQTLPSYTMTSPQNLTFSPDCSYQSKPFVSVQANLNQSQTVTLDLSKKPNVQ